MLAANANAAESRSRHANSPWFALRSSGTGAARPITRRTAIPAPNTPAGANASTPRGGPRGL